MKKLLAILLSLARNIWQCFLRECLQTKQAIRRRAAQIQIQKITANPEIDPDTVHLNGVTDKEPGLSYDAAITFADNVYYHRTISDAFKDAIADDVVDIAEKHSVIRKSVSFIQKSL